MKLCVLTAAVMAVSPISAFAADAIAEAPAAPASETVAFYDWTGAYAGATAGYGWNKTTFSGSASADKHDVNGAYAGGYVGYNFIQNGPWVAGAEADFAKDWANKAYSEGGANVELENKWSASVRGRAGYAFDRSLVYGTAGWAVTKLEMGATGPGVAFAEKETLNGWTVGAGFEQAFTDKVVGRVEYRYADFGDKRINSTEVDLDKHTVGAGISLKF